MPSAGVRRTTSDSTGSISLASATARSSRSARDDVACQCLVKSPGSVLFFVSASSGKSIIQ